MLGKLTLTDATGQSAFFDTSSVRPEYRARAFATPTVLERTIEVADRTYASWISPTTDFEALSVGVTMACSCSSFCGTADQQFTAQKAETELQGYLRTGRACHDPPAAVSPPEAGAGTIALCWMSAVASGR